MKALLYAYVYEVFNDVTILVFTGSARRLAKRHQRYVVGGGLFDWIGSAASTLHSSLTRAIGSASNFLSANKYTISNAANVIGDVAKAGSTTATAVKQIVDVVKAKRAAAETAAAGAAATAMAAAKKLPKPLEQVLSQKSLDFLQQLARSDAAGTAAVSKYPDINSRIAGAVFKSLKPGNVKRGPRAGAAARTAGNGLLLGPNSPFNNIPLLGALL